MFIKSIRWLYGREGPIHNETFTDSEVLEKKSNEMFSDEDYNCIN